MLGILQDIDIDNWTDKEIIAALDFLYGNIDDYADKICQYRIEGRHKPTTNFRNSFDYDDGEDED